MIETTSTVTTKVTLDVSDSDIERLVEDPLRRRGRIPKNANVNLEWRGSQCPYLHVTVEHQRPGSGPSASGHDWATKLDDALA
jgi:hypothetical protein